jgi:hypothetical protein
MIKKQINMSSINNFKSKASTKKSEGIKNSSQVPSSKSCDHSSVIWYYPIGENKNKVVFNPLLCWQLCFNPIIEFNLRFLFNPMGCPSTNGIPCHVSKFVNVMHGIFIK